MQAKPLSTASSGGAVSLRLLVPFLALFGAGLYTVVGLPHTPDPPLGIPDPTSLEALLRSTHPPLDGAIYLTGMVGWGLWGWLIVSLLLQLFAAGAERVATGTTAVRHLRTVADLISVPLVRKAVHASLAGSMVVRFALAGVPAAAAAAPPDQSVVVIVGNPQASATALPGSHVRAASEDPGDGIPAGSVLYMVQPGDNLAKIAERFYDDGDKWHVLYEANQGRRMQDGTTFDRAGVIHPGWRLIVPEPSEAIQTDGEGQRWYTVRKGDSLAGISARLLGDEQRWPELFEVNQGARLDSIHMLSDPRLIWPGLALRVPAVDPQRSAEAQAPQVPQEPSSAAATSTDVARTVTTAVHVTDTSQPLPAFQATPIASRAFADSDGHAAGSALTPATSAAAPPVLATPQPATPGSPPQRLISPVIGGLAGASVAVAGLAGGALVLRRRHSRPNRRELESDVAVKAGFAEAEPAEELARRPSGDDLNTARLIAARMSRAVAGELLGQGAGHGNELSVIGASLAAVRHGRSSTTLVLQQVPMAARAQLIACLPRAATRAFGDRSDVEGMVSRDGDVLVRLTGVANAVDEGLIRDSTAGEPEAWPVASVLLRLGLLADRQVFAANWDALSHVLVSAPLGHGGEAVLSALVASLVAQRSPAELGLIVLGSPRSIADELLGVTHLLEAAVDPHNEQAALEVLATVRIELDQRIASCRTDAPDVVLVLPELGELSAEHHAALAPIMLHGPQHRVRVVAASVRRAVELVQECPLLPEFATRLVLRTGDEEESVALLGSGDATELGSGGHLLARLEGRIPMQALGYRVAPDRLAALAAAIRSNTASVDWWRSRHSALDAEAKSETGGTVDVDMEMPADVVDKHLTTLQRFQQLGERDTDRQDGMSPEEQRDSQSTDQIADGESRPASEPQQLQLRETVVVPVNGANAAPPPNQLSSLAATHSDAGPDRLRAERLSTGPGGARPRFRARFLGARELVYDGKVVWPLPGDPDEAAIELLVFLGVQDPSGARGEVLGDSFWEEDDDDARADRLKKRRYRLRLALKRLVPTLEGDPLARMDKQHPVYRLNPTVIESDVHRFLKLVEEAKALAPDEAIAAYEEALELYRGDLLDRPDVPPYRWLDEGPRLLDLRVKYARMHQQARRRLADLLANGTDQHLARAEELYIGLAGDDPLDHRLWETLARLHGRRSDLLGLEATARRLRSALVELGEVEDPERVPVPPALERVFAEVRASLLNGQAA